MIPTKPGSDAIPLGSLAWEAGAMVRGGRIYATDVTEDGERVYCLVRERRREIVTCQLTVGQLDPDVGEPDHWALETLVTQCAKQLGRHKAGSPAFRFLADVMRRLERIAEEVTR